MSSPSSPSPGWGAHSTPSPSAASTLAPLPLEHGTGAARPLSWATWPATFLLVAAVLVVRLIYLIWLSPYELAGDEAYYWECSRNLSLCYYEKGPALPWLIAACCHIFGSTEWAIRLPVALASAASALAVAHLAYVLSAQKTGGDGQQTARGDPRAAFIAALLFCFIPSFQANAQICTQDGPIILLWTLLTTTGLGALRRWEAGRAGVFNWFGFAVILGIAFLFKQSILLIGSGLFLYMFIRRKSLPWSAGLILQVLVVVLVFILMLTPMMIWNHQHGWPTLTHTLGHLGAPGGDHDAEKDAEGWSILWPLSLIGSQVGVVGPAALLLMGLAIARAIHRRKADPATWPANLWLICASVPSVGFFVLLSFIKPVIATWPFPSYAPLVPLAALMILTEIDRRSIHAADPAATRRRPKKTLAFEAWKMGLTYGAIAWVIIAFPNMLGHLPYLGGMFQGSVLKRISGHRAHAAELAARIDSHRDPSGLPTIVITRYYQEASLDAFYLPGQPVVFNAGTATGQRMTSYDFWPATDVNAPELKGRYAVLDGHSPTRPWDTVIKYKSLLRVPKTKFTLVTGYGGLK